MGEKLNKNTAKNNTILVIRLSAMGDVAMTVPVLIALTSQYPHLRLTVLSKAFLKPLFEQLPQVTFKAAEVKGKHSGVGGLYKLFLELKRDKPTAVADLHGVIRSNVLGGFFRTAGIKVKKIDKGRKEKKALTRSKNKVFKPLRSTQERYVEVFEKLGFPIDLKQSYTLEKRSINKEISQKLAISGQKLIGFAPFAAHEGKKYPLNRVEEVIAELSKQKDQKILLFGGGKEEERQLELLTETHENVINVAGKFSFSEELDIISNLHVMVAMDSGNGHLAGIFGVPVITVWGVTHPYLGFAVYNQPQEHQIMANREDFPLIPTSVYGNKMPTGYEKVMEGIPAQKIVDQVNKVLGN
ncbi:glycosyltransferase family 9 protein [Flavimarina sp. Hel_I_48]|uniref:glycosyltransferase family 9 protein n=1 Tax=Flavimarina sp. Hel_I_48 TaxID=1392488 RepID=UPI0004DF5BE7|nr:glycosyltransferase family 9 protein [Flavimarina sp. Hel_I_48]